jgi:drug/metabolite transporter (DMT)-like permease
MKWLFVAAIVGSTIAVDYLQATAVKAHGEFNAALFRRGRLLLSIVFMAVSFFSFTQLLAVADLSFAVPATALTIPAETFMARSVLRENVGAKRWGGALLVALGVALIEL